MGRTRIDIAEARCICASALRSTGFGENEAQAITDHLVDAELRGHPFAGLARALSIIEHLRSTGLGATGFDSIEILRDGPSFVRLNGNDAVGYLVVRKATEMAIEKAKLSGVSVVGANGFWYSGNLAYFAEMATLQNLICIITSNATPLVAPHGGIEARFSTNPICIGCPTSRPDSPVIWDIGTSNIMYAQIKLAERVGTTIPEGSAIDRHGSPTIDPLAALQGTMTVWGGHKGSGLAMMIQLLGAAAGSAAVPPHLSNFGCVVMVFDPAILRPLEEFLQEADSFRDYIHSTKTLPGEQPVRMPFEGSCARRQAAYARGCFELDQEVLSQLRDCTKA